MQDHSTSSSAAHTPDAATRPLPALPRNVRFNLPPKGSQQGTPIPTNNNGRSDSARLMSRRDHRFVSADGAPLTPSSAPSAATSSPPLSAIPQRDRPADDIYTSSNLVSSGAAEVGSLRRLYNDNLRDSMRRVTEALAIDLPEDHVFRQLMADPSTALYCKVRLAEVVEAVLYSAQAEQYNHLVLQLMRYTYENSALTERLQQVELASTNTPVNATGRHQHQQTQVSPPEREAADDGEAAARATLATILQETTKVSELSRSSEALQATARLVQAAEADDARGAQPPIYLRTTLTGLVASVLDLLRYVDTSLASLQALREELESDRVQQGAAPTVQLHGDPATSSAPPPPQHLSDVAAAREHVHLQMDKLEAVEHHSLDVLERWATATRKLQDEVRQLQEEAGKTALVAQELQELSQAFERQRQDAAQAAGAAQQDLHDQLHRQKEELHNVAGKLATAERTVAEQAEALRAAEATIADAQRDLSDCREQLASLQAEMRVLAEDRSRLEADLSESEADLVAAHATLRLTTLEKLYHESEVGKRDLLERLGYRAAMAGAQLALHAQQEELRHREVRQQLSETAALEHEVALRSGIESLSALLHVLREDERATASPARSADLQDTASTSVTDAEPREAEWRVTQQRHRLPTTLAGLVAAVERDYKMLRVVHGSRETALRQTKRTVAEQAEALRDAETRLVDAQLELKDSRERLARLQAEMEGLLDNNPMRPLLARQDALLQTLTEERGALRQKWRTLNADYITLEQRNGLLHERCASKELENARLTGLLRSRQSSVRSSPQALEGQRAANYGGSRSFNEESYHDLPFPEL